MRKPGSTFKVILVVILTLVLCSCGMNREFAQEQISNIPTEQVQAAQTIAAPDSLGASNPQIPLKPEEAKRLLEEGNDRYFHGISLINDTSPKRRKELSAGQNPFAVIVSCSDSRVIPEEIFDQGLGDLFVIRVAGNVVSALELGSIEYAAEHLKVPLILVLGHEQCGAVTAAVEGADLPGNLKAIAEKIKPAVAELDPFLSKEEAINQCAELNVRKTLEEISQSSVIQHSLGENLKLYGGIYELSTGKVRWLDNID